MKTYKILLLPEAKYLTYDEVGHTSKTMKADAKSLNKIEADLFKISRQVEDDLKDKLEHELLGLANDCNIPTHTEVTMPSGSVRRPITAFSRMNRLLSSSAKARQMRESYESALEAAKAAAAKKLESKKEELTARIKAERARLSSDAILTSRNKALKAIDYFLEEGTHQRCELEIITIKG